MQATAKHASGTSAGREEIGELVVERRESLEQQNETSNGVEVESAENVRKDQEILQHECGREKGLSGYR